MVTVKCAGCGKEIEVWDCLARKQEKFFCSRACRRAKIITVTCAFCGKEKQVPEYVAKRSTRFYCDIYCLGKYKSAHAKKVEVTCEECGKKVLKWPREVSKSKKHFCSNKCSAMARSKQVGVKCDWCGKDVYYPKSHVNRSEKHFCDKNCMAAWKSVNECGDNNHNYSKVKVHCYICGKEIDKKKSQAERYRRHFCSLKCKKIYYQSTEFRSLSSQRSLKMLSSYPRRTKPEKLTRSMLDELGIPCSEQVVIGNKFCVDFLVGHLVIEVFGDYFHANPIKYGHGEGLKPLDNIQKKSVLNDKRKIKYLEKCGYKVLILWEHEIKQEPLLVKQKLKQYCKEAT